MEDKRYIGFSKTKNMLKDVPENIYKHITNLLKHNVINKIKTDGEVGAGFSSYDLKMLNPEKKKTKLIIKPKIPIK